MPLPEDFGAEACEFVERVFRNDLRDAKRSEHEIFAALEKHHYSMEVQFAIKLALEEALTNAVKHGNQHSDQKQIRVRYCVRPDRTIIAVQDQGGGFALEDVPDPTRDENLERPSGRGIMLMQAYMTRVAFNAEGNEVWLLKENRTEAPQVSDEAPSKQS